MASWNRGMAADGMFFLSMTQPSVSDTLGLFGRARSASCSSRPPEGCWMSSTFPGLEIEGQCAARGVYAQPSSMKMLEPNKKRRCKISNESMASSLPQLPAAACTYVNG